MHLHDFVLFLVILLGLAVAIVAVFFATGRRTPEAGDLERSRDG